MLGPAPKMCDSQCGSASAWSRLPPPLADKPRQDAQKNFLKVIKKSSNYDMVFCAQMHLAKNYDGSDASRNSIMKQFTKMLEEKKNADFKDQIYYALSEIARIDEDDSLRKDYLAKSVAAYTNNNYQRTFSSIALADLYFEQNEYRIAQSYYDTAVLSIPKNYPNYEVVMKKSQVLKNLVDKLDEILRFFPHDVSMVMKPHRSLNPLFRLRGLSGMNFFFIIIRVGYPYGCREMS